jgi:hypothetical protein
MASLEARAVSQEEGINGTSLDLAGLRQTSIATSLLLSSTYIAHFNIVSALDFRSTEVTKLASALQLWVVGDRVRASGAPAETR